VRALEQMPLKRRQGWRSWLMRIQRLALLTNLYVALGAGCLCYAATHLQNLATSLPALNVAMLYVMSMHILNHLTGRPRINTTIPTASVFTTVINGC
jgi:membrane protease YdiL (CAAX protease family)